MIKMIIFNEEPKIKYEISDDVKEEILDNGYALPQDDLEIKENNSAVLHFMNVDDHVDGNGLSILWLIDGEGSFFIEDKEYNLGKGDVLLFDDNIEHGFSSKVICTAVNFTIQDIGMDIDSIKKLVKNYNENNKNIEENRKQSKQKRIR